MQTNKNKCKRNLGERLIMVSVIIPTYGHNTDPCRAIDSVLAQDYPEIQVIVVDDNGEGTEQQKANELIFLKYKTDNRVKYIKHKTNKGGSAARNTGVRNSEGRYLCFLDDDDYFSDCTKIRKQMEANMGLDDEWAGSYSSCKLYKGDEFVRELTAQVSGSFLKEYLTGKVRLETAAPIITRLSYDRINGFDESFQRHQDWEFFARLLDQYKLKAVPEATYTRAYKTDVKRKSMDVYLGYMNKFTSSMAINLHSINKDTLDKILRRKYMQIVLPMLREGRIKDAFKLMREKRFGLYEYSRMLLSIINYAYMRVRYGTHF